MATAEQFAKALCLQQRGVHVLVWDHKPDLVKALLILKSCLANFPNAPVVVPTTAAELQRFSLALFEEVQNAPNATLRVYLIPQASTEAVGGWVNSWRQPLATTPGTLLVVRRADLMELTRRAPDLMSFAQSDVYESTGLLPLVTRDTLEHISINLSEEWTVALRELPGSLPSAKELGLWRESLEANL